MDKKIKLLEEEIEQVLKTKSLFKKDLSGVSQSIEALKSSLKESGSAISLEVAKLQKEIIAHSEEFDKKIQEISSNKSPDYTEQLKQLSEIPAIFTAKISEIKANFENEIKSLRESSGVYLDRVEIIDKNFLKFEKDLKRYAKDIYSYGTSFAILNNGINVGSVTGLNLKAGTNMKITTTPNNDGTVTAKFDATGGGGSNGWTYYATTWSTAPSVNSAIAGGIVYNYTLSGTTRYRFVPTTYDPTTDAFYSTFSGGVLSGIIIARG